MPFQNMTTQKSLSPVLFSKTPVRLAEEKQKDPILLARNIKHCPGWQCNVDGKGGSKHASIASWSWGDVRNLSL